MHSGGGICPRAPAKGVRLFLQHEIYKKFVSSVEAGLVAPCVINVVSVHMVSVSSHVELRRCDTRKTAILSEPFGRKKKHHKNTICSVSDGLAGVSHVLSTALLGSVPARLDFNVVDAVRRQPGS